MKTDICAVRNTSVENYPFLGDSTLGPGNACPAHSSGFFRQDNCRYFRCFTPNMHILAYFEESHILRKPPRALGSREGVKMFANNFFLLQAKNISRKDPSKFGDWGVKISGCLGCIIVCVYHQPPHHPKFYRGASFFPKMTSRQTFEGFLLIFSSAVTKKVYCDQFDPPLKLPRLQSPFFGD